MTGPARSAAPDHLPALDGLRGVAILAVLVSHFRPFTPGNPLRLLLQEVGWTGVDLFFVLSGFLITRILLHTRTDPNYFTRFYARRTLRIFPLYYASTFVIAIVLPRLGVIGEQVARGYGWSVWLYVQNYLPESVVTTPTGNLLDVTWSLCVEEQFYVIWPALVWWVRPARLVRWCLGGIALAVVVRMSVWAVAPEYSSVFRWAPARLDSLLLGAALAIAFVEDPTLRCLRRYFPWSAGLGVAGMVAIACARGNFDFRDPAVWTVGMSLVAVVYASWLGFTLTHPTGARLLSGPLLRMFGKYSYALYLLHSLAGGLANKLWRRFGGDDSAAGHALYFALATGLSLLLSLSSWHVLERPFLRLKARWPNPS